MKQSKKTVSALVLCAVLALSALPVSAAPVTSPAPAAPADPASITVPYKTYTEADHGIIVAEPEAVDPAKLPDPLVIKFSSLPDLGNSGGKLAQANGDEGEYSYTTAPDGTKCLGLEYAPKGNWGAYRCMPALLKGDLISEDYKYVRVTYMTEDPIGGQFVFTNNGSGTSVVLTESTHVSAGKWVTTNAKLIGGTDIIARLASGKHITLQFKTVNADTKYFIKEMAFFGSEAQAYDYYGDEPTMEGITCSELRFGADSNGSTVTGQTDSGASYGIHSVSDEGTLDITYAEKTNVGAMHYMAKVKFKDTKTYNQKHVFMRVLYSADHPDGVESCAMFMRHDGNSECFRVAENVIDTNGKYVLSETSVIGPSFPERYSKGQHTSLMIGCPIEGGTYSIKAIYFFPDRASADAYTVTEGTHKISVNGNDISEYKIVIAKDAAPIVVESAQALYKRVVGLSGVELPVVTDDTAETDKEILVGRSNREVSNSIVDALPYNINNYVVKLIGNKVVISSYAPGTIDVATDLFLDNYLYRGQSTIPNAISLDASTLTYEGAGKKLTPYYGWQEIVNVENPDHFTDDFDADDGYFTEENNTDSFAIANGVLEAKADTKALTYIHVYEKNAVVSAKIKYTAAKSGADFGLMQRYCAEDAYVKAGYDKDRETFYITYREGLDFNSFTLGEYKMALTEGEWYNLTFKLDGKSASLSVNGTEIIAGVGVEQVTPGRLAIYAENVTLAVDDYDAELTSGQGTVMKNIVHTKLPTDKYLEGGTVIEMLDKSLIYRHSGGTTYKSVDNGLTWTETEKWSDINSYPTVLRLNNGDLIKTTKSGSYICSFTSKDEGATWTQGGNIAIASYKGTDGKTAGAGNMNDKMFQAANGRIFYSQNYEGSARPDGRQVFCIFYYSDDNGATWTESETTSWEIEGNENQVYFGECKLLECADGTIRMYNSWNDYGCIVYSDSTDGGKTFGPLVKMPEFVCARSSMQFVRDTYADNDHTYYMVWVNSEPMKEGSPMNRSRLSLAKSIDGKEWEFLGDIWRWESNYTASGAGINHIVDPFIKTTENYVLIGTGYSERMATGDDYTYHQAQRQHIWSVKKDTLPEGRTVTAFADVSPAAPYNEAVAYAVNAGLFNGTGEKTFSPASPMTRAMFVTVLGRLAMADVSAYATPTFNDVIAGQWYTSYVEWAAANGIVNGLGNGIYGINDNVTIQQACVILARYADYKVASAQTGKTAADFADGASVATWAAKEVDWAIANGVYAGAGANLNPTSPASRATVATMFANYVKAYGA